MAQHSVMGEAVRDVLKGKKGKFVPGCSEPYEISRSKIQLFFNCQRCFWLDRRYGIAPPSSPPYTLNSAVDELLKREFDGYRAAREVPPLLKNRGLLLYPAQHMELARWRTNLIGGDSMPTGRMATSVKWNSTSGCSGGRDC